ncbi:PEP-CTERM sorting domain-containing protein [Hydrogenophaga sp.]|uniref:PEP-CTERM sorting domain-containing protein n=1 Tax=Hydrogenophaga sp. TaxID=1904254 RepID=UPI00356609A1
MMMKLKSLLAGVAFAVVSVAASATPWTQTIDFNPDVYISNNTYSWTHDLTTDGFNPGSDLITNFNLSVTIKDERDSIFSSWEWAAIDLPGVFDDAIWFSPIGSNNAGGNDFFGYLQLNTSGLLSVSLSSVLGDFLLDKSTLTASGFDGNKNQIPEPGILALLGLGLAGMAVLRRRTR